MSETKVVSVRSKEWKETPENRRKYIGRRGYGFPASEWGNPFKVKWDSDGEEQAESRKEALAAHESWLRERMKRDPQLIISLRNLRGMVLGCWCKTQDQPDRPCHGDLLKWLIESSDREYQRWLQK